MRDALWDLYKMAVVGMTPADPPTIPLQTVVTTQELAVLARETMRTKDRLVQKAPSLLEGSLGYFLHHTLAQHTSMAGGMKGRWSGKE